MARYRLAEIKAKGYKEKESWWTVLLSDPIAARLLYLTCNYTGLRPNHLTAMSVAVGTLSGYIFWQGTRLSLVVGALVYHTAFVFDCMDGKTARIRGIESNFGAWLDYAADRWRVAVNTIALMGGQFRITGNEVFLYLAFAVMFLDMLRYVDALQIWRQRRQMRDKIAETRAMIDEAIARHTGPGARAAGPAPVVDLKEGFNQRFRLYLRIRDWMIARRVRPHLMSGIEYQLFVLVVAPLSGRVIWVTVGASIALLLFEAADIYALWLSGNEMQVQLERMVADARRSYPGVQLFDPSGIADADELRRRLERWRERSSTGGSA